MSAQCYILGVFTVHSIKLVGHLRMRTNCATSVFTGLPKAAVLKHKRVWRGSFLLTFAGVRSDDVIYINLPLYHSAAFLMGLCGTIERGNT